MTEFDTCQWHWSLQDMTIFSLLCEHSRYTADFSFCTDLSIIRKHYLQSDKDNYCISKCESSKTTREQLTFEAQKIIDEVTNDDCQADADHVKHVVLNLFHDVANWMNISFSPQIVGSSHERTRNFLPNEFDVLCVIEHTPATLMRCHYNEMRYIADNHASQLICDFHEEFDNALNKAVKLNDTLTQGRPMKFIEKKRKTA